jgi:hypothetical protein
MFPYQGWPFGARPGFRDEVELLLDGKDAAMDAIAGALHQLHTMGRGSSPGGHCGHHGAGAGNEGGVGHEAHAGHGHGPGDGHGGSHAHGPHGHGACGCCATPATMMFDLLRSSISYWQATWSALYANAPCLPCAMAQGLAPWLNPAYACGCHAGHHHCGHHGHGGGHAGGGAGREPIRLSTEPGVKATTTFRFANYSKDTVDITFQVSGFQNDGRPEKPEVRVFPEDGRSIVGPGETRKFILEIDPKRFEPGIVYTGAILAKTPFLKRLDVEFQVAAKGADEPKTGGGEGT